jgi:hypothetical protein
MINADEMRLIMFRYGPAIVALRIRSSGKKQKAKGKRQKAKGKSTPEPYPLPDILIACSVLL